MITPLEFNKTKAKKCCVGAEAVCFHFSFHSGWNWWPQVTSWVTNRRWKCSGSVWKRVRIVPEMPTLFIFCQHCLDPCCIQLTHPSRSQLNSRNWTRTNASRLSYLRDGKMSVIQNYTLNIINLFIKGWVFWTSWRSIIFCTVATLL